MPEPMSMEELEAFRESAPERVGGELWSLLDWSFWGAGMADVFREPLADTMLAAVPGQVREHAEAIMADFIERRGIKKTGVTVYQEQRAEVERLTEEVARLRQGISDLHARWVRRARDNGDYYNRTAEKYELGKATAFDAAAEEIRSLIGEEAVKAAVEASQAEQERQP